MTETVHKKDHTLAELLFAEPYRFDFFQAVRLLERIYSKRRAVGSDSDPAREVARFKTHVSLMFPASQIYALTPEREVEDKTVPPQMVVAFMGMTGPSGVMPHAYTELLMERLRNKDTALHEFLDLFNHRIISLFYRAWEKYRFPIGVERGRGDRFTEFLFDFVGLGTRGLRNRFSFKDEGLLRYGGLISNKPHSASAIAGILGDYFGVTARLEQFKGQWLRLEPENYSTLGQANHQLGLSTVVGTRVWDTQSKVRIRFGPLSFDRFLAFLPNGTAFKPAAEMTRFLTGQEFDFEVQLVLLKQQVPGCRLTTKANVNPRLGWTTWLKTTDFKMDDDQVVLASSRMK